MIKKWTMAGFPSHVLFTQPEGFIYQGRGRCSQLCSKELF